MKFINLKVELMNILSWSFLTCIFLLVSFSCQNKTTLEVSPDGHFIMQSNGEPFIWLGDTAWELFHKLTREEADKYLAKRAEQGFTVIQAVVLAEMNGLRTPNAYGDLPFIELSPDEPNEKYFKHVDYIINMANSLGLYIGLLPTWGDKLYSNNPGKGPVVFNIENAERYGEFLGQRYRNKKIVWILGGDRAIVNEEVMATWNAMARGLRKGDKGNHLITFHPYGGTSSSQALHQADWIDFNMYQSGHDQKIKAVYEYAKKDYNLCPAKPTVEGEPAYEDIPVKFWEYCDWSTPGIVPEGVMNSKGFVQNPSYFKDGYITDYEVRIHAYWNLLSGACGYTYGHNAVWQMYEPGKEFAIPCRFDWITALDRPGANQIIFLKVFLKARPISAIIPDESIVIGENPKDENHVCAARFGKNEGLIIYLSTGQKVTVDLNKISGDAVVGNWYNPSNGTLVKIDTVAKEGFGQFSPPTHGLGNDWLLLLDHKDANLALPK